MSKLFLTGFLTNALRALVSMTHNILTPSTKHQEREKVKKDEREMNKKLFFFFSILVRTVPKWNSTVHMWQKL